MLMYKNQESDSDYSEDDNDKGIKALRLLGIDTNK